MNDSPGRAERPPLHVFTTMNKPHGGFMSACGLMTRLRRHFHVTAWSLFREIEESNRERLKAAVDRIGDIGVVPVLGDGDHALFYMNEYPMHFGNFSSQWMEALDGATSVQIVMNRTTGGLHHEHWLSGVVTRMYFHDSGMRHTWRVLTRESPLADLPAEVLAPPVELEEFFELRAGRPAPPPVVVGRLAGDTDVPDNAVSFYGRLAEALPGAEFWFMPAPEPLRAAYREHPGFRFLEKDELPVSDFLAACHVFALTYSGVPVPGPRSLMEAMAAGCAPVTIDRNGPRDRIVQGESGFRTNNDDEMIDYIVQLATNAPLRERISRGAAQRAAEFDPDNWVSAIVDTCLRI